MQQWRSRALVNARGTFPSTGRECCNFQLKLLCSHGLPSPCVWFATLCQALQPLTCTLLATGSLELPELCVLCAGHKVETDLGNVNKREQEGPNLTSFEPCDGAGLVLQITDLGKLPPLQK